MKKKILLVLIAVLGIVAIIVGTTYAFFSFTKHGSTENVIRAGNIAFHYDEISGKGRGIKLIDALPVDSDEEEKSNNNYFDFKITAESDIAEIPYTVTAKLSEDTTLDLDVIKVYLTEVVEEVETPLLYTTLDQLRTVTFKDGELELYTDIVPVNGQSYERNFRLRMWMAEDTNFISGAYSNKKLSLTVNVYTNQGSALNEENLTTPDDTNIKMVSANNRFLLEKSEEENVDYEVSVPNEVDTVSFKATTRNIAAKAIVRSITTNQESENYDLEVGDNYFKLSVESADESKTTNYTLDVNREPSKDNNLTYLAVDGYSFTEEFDKDTLTYHVTLEANSINIVGNKSSDVATIEGLGEKNNLVWGENTFEVVVTPEDPNTEAKTYTIVVNNQRPEAPVIRINTASSVATSQVVDVSSQGTAITGVDHYEVYAVTNTTAPTDATVATTTTTNSYTLSTAGTYYVYYRTVSTSGNKSLWSSSLKVTVAPTCSYAVGKYWDYNYVGRMQSFTVPCNGTYQIQVYGAQGGSNGSTGGAGGYAVGNKVANKNTVWYIGVGGAGGTANSSDSTQQTAGGGWNGGASGIAVGAYSWPRAAGGGGATHVGLTNSLLSGTASGNLLIAAGGGGGAVDRAGGAGGGSSGSAGAAHPNVGGGNGGGGTQSAGGPTGGGYGTGGKGQTCGGGGGYYGGGGNTYAFAGAGGGSGYIGGVTGGSMSNGARSGNGFVRITLKAIN